MTDEARCELCGLSRRDCLPSLGLTEQAATQPVVETKEDFAQGLFRRGLARINRALEVERDLLEAWILKSRFLNSIGYNRSAAGMLGSSIEAFTNPADRIELLEEQSFLWAECQNGEHSLRSADAAIALGSESIRVHYLRGRSLALLGQLETARTEMVHVLSLDPQNPDALRGLSMIDAAIGPRSSNPWWKFW